MKYSGGSSYRERVSGGGVRCPAWGPFSKAAPHTWLLWGCSLWRFLNAGRSLWAALTPLKKPQCSGPAWFYYFLCMDHCLHKVNFKKVIYKHLVDTKILVYCAVGFGLWKPRDSHMSDRRLTQEENRTIKSEFCYPSKNHNKSLMRRYSVLSRYSPQIGLLAQQQLFYNVRTNTGCDGFAKSTSAQISKLLFYLDILNYFNEIN